MAAAKIKLAALGTGIYYVSTKLGSGSSSETPHPPAPYYRPQYEDGYSQINAGPSPPGVARSPAPSHHQGEGYLPINPKR